MTTENTFSAADAERMHRTLVALDDYLKGFGDPLAETIKGIVSHTLLAMTPAPQGDL